MAKSTFLGRVVAQSDTEISFWEHFLSQREFARIVEFGTYRGNFSLYLYLYCLQNKKEFYTYDNQDWKSLDKRQHLKNKLGFDKHFKLCDIFEIESEIGELISSPGLSIVFCDNGNKPEELKIFSKYLKSGDIIVSHDWLTEVREKDLPYNLEVIATSHDSIFLKRL